MSACAKCGMKLMSATTVNGLFVCDWCKPKPEAPTVRANNSTCNCKEPAYDHRGWCAACDKWMHPLCKPEPPPAQAPGAREWWIVERPNGDGVHLFCDIDTAKHYADANELSNGCQHVIEYAAYLREKQHATVLFKQNEERSQAHEALERELAARTERVDDLIAGLKQARAELAEAKRTLADYEHECEAIAKYKDGK